MEWSIRHQRSVMKSVIRPFLSFCFNLVKGFVIYKIVWRFFATRLFIYKISSFIIFTMCRITELFLTSVDSLLSLFLTKKWSEIKVCIQFCLCFFLIWTLLDPWSNESHKVDICTVFPVSDQESINIYQNIKDCDSVSWTEVTYDSLMTYFRHKNGEIFRVFINKTAIQKKK